ncbi:hypothetical protein CHS0354_035974 [Potamilus streckersoni]|uniref:Uncharacterized protein n=1 Tax=Potamilus streckersoni TaxID=2493646 RepID=A0AAE0SC80_9BIVA|nr:hypothetical protein CHS0354_035974 [Potamilus streckersoni]
MTYIKTTGDATVYSKLKRLGAIGLRKCLGLSRRVGDRVLLRPFYVNLAFAFVTPEKARECLLVPSEGSRIGKKHDQLEELLIHLMGLEIVWDRLEQLHLLPVTSMKRSLRAKSDNTGATEPAFCDFNEEVIKGKIRQLHCLVLIKATFSQKKDNTLGGLYTEMEQVDSGIMGIRLKLDYSVRIWNKKVSSERIGRLITVFPDLTTFTSIYLRWL